MDMIRSNRKGMIAFFDTMIFIVVIGIVITLIFTNTNDDLDHVDAREIHDDLFATELRVSDVFDIDDPRILKMQDIIAIHLQTGKGEIGDYITTVLRSLVPMSHGFTFECTLDDAEMRISDRAGDMMSRYTAEMSVMTGGMMRTTLTLH